MENYRIPPDRHRQSQEAIAAARRDKVERVIGSIVENIFKYGISLEEVRVAYLSVARKKRGKNLPKYCPVYFDPLSGRTWGGRGRPPKWIEGKNFDDFLLQPE